MDYREAYQKLEEHEQLHVLQYYEELEVEKQRELLEQIRLTDFEVLKKGARPDEEKKEKQITPIRAMQLDEIEQRKGIFRQTGLEAIRAGKVAAVLLAGGMGTRLGSDGPKGVYDIGLTRPIYIFECLISNLLDVVREADRWIYLFVMTSEKNHMETVTFLQEHEYFGYRPDHVVFFQQQMAPASDYDGKVYMEEKGRIATSPNGNGGWFSSMERHGILDLIHREGIEWLNVFAVDNVLQRIADPEFVGAVLEEKVACGAKVIRKNARDEKVGVMCLNHGRPSIVEYYELSEEMMDAVDVEGEPLYNFGVILNYLFREEDLERIVSQELPLHRVEKKIPYLNEKGVLIKPEAPNGYKYESLVLDMIEMLQDCLPYEVVREKEFAPIKNKTGVDSVDSARELLKQNGIEL